MSSTSHQGVKSSSQSLYHKIDPSVLHRLLLGFPRVLRLPIKYHANSLSGLHKRGRLPGYTRYEIGKFSRDIYGLDLSQQLRAWPPARKPRMVSSSGNTETPRVVLGRLLLAKPSSDNTRTFTKNPLREQISWEVSGGMWRCIRWRHGRQWSANRSTTCSSASPDPRAWVGHIV